MWLTIALVTAAAVVGLVALTGQIATLISGHSGRKWMMLIAGIGLIGGLLCAVGAHFVLREYQAEKEAADDKQKQETVFRKQLENANKELAAARAKSEVLEQKRRLQIERTGAIAGRIARAIEEGGSIRYKFVDARNTDPKRFHAEFQAVHAAAIEKWRPKTAATLDEVLPPFHLGTSFSNIEGKSGESGDIYQLTKLDACIDMLRGVLRDLPNYIERMTP